MLAAIPTRRHRGVGYALKLAQRAQALDQGIHVARWTFDPLVARNAWFNMGKLGTVADEFRRGFYGEMADEINRGDRTDRLFVRWDLDPARRRASRRAARRLAAEGASDARTGPARRGRAGGALVEVPSDHPELRRGTRRWRPAGGTPAPTALIVLRGGLIVGAFDRDRSAYVLVPEAGA